MPLGTTIHRLRITLDHVQPALWRRIEVESDSGIDFAASAIRCAFGWSFDHAYKLVIRRREYGTFNGWIRNDPEQEFEEKRRQIQRQKLRPQDRARAMTELFDWCDSQRASAQDDENAIPSLMELAPRAGSKFKFVYDFGDWWEHTIRVEKVEKVLPGVAYPRCIEGALANPLEDCGGPWNLMAVFDAVQHPERPRTEAIQHIVKNWVGEGWDFTRFSVEEANERFRKMFRSEASESE